MANSRPVPPGLGEAILEYCEQTGTVVWVYDADTRSVVFVNNVYERLWGRAPEDLYDNVDSWLDGVHPDDREAARVAFSTPETGRQEQEFRVRRPDGSTSYVQCRAVAFQSGPGGGRRQLGIVEDRTAERELDIPLATIAADLPTDFPEAAQALLGMVVEQTGAAKAFIGQVDPEDAGQVRTIEARDSRGRADAFVYSLSGSPCENVVGGRLCCYTEDVFVQFPRDLALKGREGYLGVPLSGPSGETTAIMVALFDTPITDEIRARTIFRVVGERLGAALERHHTHSIVERAVDARTTDLSALNQELRKSEERYRVFVERSAVGIWCLELDPPMSLELDDEAQHKHFTDHARIAECNDMVAVRLGRRSGKELAGTPVRDLPAFWTEENQASLMESIRRGFELSDVARTIELGDGDEQYLRVDLVPILEEGALVRLWCTERDVTADLAREDNRAMHISRLIHFSRLSTLGEMAGGIAHELNQPLAAIVNYARGCVRRMQGGDPELISALESIVDQAGRAGDSLRSLRKLSTGDPQERVPTSVREILEAAVSALTHRQRASKVDVQVFFDAEDDSVLVAPIQVEQVFMQVLRNAYDNLERTSADDRRVEVHITGTPRGVEVVIRDYGEGLTPVQATHAFEPFFSGTKGVGLGLAVSRNLIEGQGGRLWHTAPLDGGAAFHFTLPAASVRQNS